MNRIVAVSLLLVLILLGIFGITNYNALLNSDGFTYLSWARTLAAGEFGGDPGIYAALREHWPEGRVSLESGNRHLDGGFIFIGVDPGYPLLLAGAIRLFGFPAAFFINPLLGLVVVLAGFFFFRSSFSPSTSAPAAAVLGVILLLLLPPGRILLSTVKIMRDIPPLAFLALSYALLASSRPRAAAVRIPVAFAFLAAAVLVRYNYMAYAVPALIYLLVRRSPASSRPRSCQRLLVPLLVLAVAVGGIMVKDSLIHGDCLDSIRIVSAYFASPEDTGDVFSPENFSRSGSWYLEMLFRVYTPILLLAGIVGLILARTRRELVLLLGTVAVNLSLCAIFRYRHTRYLLPFYLCFSGLAAYGVLEGTTRLRKFCRRCPSGLAGGLFLLVLAAVLLTFSRERLVPELVLVVSGLGILLRLDPEERRARHRFEFLATGTLLAVLASEIIPQAAFPRHFTLADARRLGREVNRHTVPGSLVVCARYLKQNIEMYSHCYSLNLNQISTPFSLKPEQSVELLMGKGIEVYGLDNKGRRKAERFLSYLREYFRLEPVASWRSDDLNIRYAYFSENENLRLFRILPWSARKVEAVLPGSGGRLALLDMRHCWWDSDRDRIQARSARGRLEVDVRDLYDYLLFPAGSGRVLTLFSDRGLPVPQVMACSSAAEPLELAVGCGLQDWKWLSPEFFRQPGGKTWRTFFDRASVRVPPFPGITFVSLRVRARGGETTLIVRLASRELTRVSLPEGSWEEVEIRLPPGRFDMGARDLELAARRGGEAGELDLEKIKVSRGGGR